MKLYTLIVPVAGAGKRMQSDIPKTLTMMNGRSLLSISTNSLMQFASKTILVTSSVHKEKILAEAIKSKLPNPTIVEQLFPNGTAFAVLQALKITDTEIAIIVWGDHIGAEKFPIENFINNFKNYESDVYLPIIEVKNPYVYFKIDKEKIIDFNETKKGAPFINKGFSDVGVFCIKPKSILSKLEKWTNNNEDSDDLNFLSFFASEISRSLRIKIIKLKDRSGMLSIGINSKLELEAIIENKSKI